ncbi:hypothetical protein [Cellulomonas sp. SG140]|uniref:hypothetical protein n=1 Tax=Cellulomonas sp. SG140 TaxID=2976536 RepID=UPI0021E7F982|nr:hypothetical protein [Cellulomonas sp. SG140]
MNLHDLLDQADVTTDVEAQDGLPPGVSLGAFTSASGRASLQLNQTAFDFHLRVEDYESADTDELTALLRIAESLGFELMDDDECPPVYGADGSATWYLTPVVTVMFA